MQASCACHTTVVSLYSFPEKASSYQLETIHSSGVNTFAFVGPLLPGNPERLIENLEGKVDTVFIDRMNYVYSVRGFYHQLGLQEKMTDRFFREYRERLISELEKRNMKFQVLF